jgi:hypothetical protein
MLEQYTTLIGIAIQTALFLLGGYSMVLRNDWSNKNLKAEVTEMQNELQKLSEIVTQMAVQTVRLNNLNDQFIFLQRTVEDLRRGNGFIQKRVDSEYP